MIRYQKGHLESLKSYIMRIEKVCVGNCHGCPGEKYCSITKLT